MIRAHSLLCSLVLALLVSNCTIAMSPTITLTPSRPVDTIPAPAATSLFPTTHIPVTWASLNLTGKLVYVSTRREADTITAELRMLDLSTGMLTTLLSAAGAWIYYATISPDAKSLVVSYTPPRQTDSSSNRSLYLMPLDVPGPPQPLLTPPTPDDHYTQAEWSPDGRYIYYVHYNHNDAAGGLYELYQIFRMDYPEGKSEKILDRAFWPRLSSDSTRLVYVTLDPASGENELFVANSDGSNPQQILLSGSQVPEIIDAPIFSPDGQSILFSAPGPSQSYQPNWFEKLIGIQVVEAHSVPSDWWSVPLTGGVPTRLTNIQTINLFASISPDKQHLASVSGDGLFVMDLDGSNLIRLIFDPEVHGTVSWIP